MIKVDISMALFLYLLFTAVLVLLAWSFFDFGTRLKSFSSDEKFIWHCSICANTYIDSMHEDVSKCPRCGSFNEKIVRGNILRMFGRENRNKHTEKGGNK